MKKILSLLLLIVSIMLLSSCELGPGQSVFTDPFKVANQDVICKFQNSDKLQKCWLARFDRFYCEGISECSFRVHTIPRSSGSIKTGSHSGMDSSNCGSAPGIILDDTPDTVTFTCAAAAQVPKIVLSECDQLKATNTERNAQISRLKEENALMEQQTIATG